MSLRYRNNSGEETIIAGLTPGGDIEAGAVMTRTGIVNIPSISTSSLIDVTFTEPMPDDDYEVTLWLDETDPSGKTMLFDIYNKTANGFSIICNRMSLGASTPFKLKYKAFKTYTVQHDVANSEAIATIQQSIPAGAGAGNQLTTKSYVDNADNALDTRLDNLEDLVPVGASISNQLATANDVARDTTPTDGSAKLVTSGGVKAAIDTKQDTLTFDNAPTAGSNNPVKSSGIKSAIDDIYEVMGKNGAKNLLCNEVGTTEMNGVTFTVNSNGSVTASGTASTTTWFQINYGFKLKDTNYTLTGCPSGGGASTYEVQFRSTEPDSSQWQFCVDHGVGATVTGDPNRTYVSFIGIQSGVTVSNLTFYPMIRLASDADSTYQPYAMTNQQMTPIVQTITNPNLLDNPFFTVNQRGLSTLSTAGHLFDRWRMTIDIGTLNAVDSGMELDATSNAITLCQKSDYDTRLWDGTTQYTWTMDFTVEAKPSSSNSMTLFANRNATVGGYLTTIINFAPSSYTAGQRYMISGTNILGSDGNITKSCALVWLYLRQGWKIILHSIKVEKGTISTLANDTIPNYQQELLKCQRHYYRTQSVLDETRYRTAHQCLAINTNALSGTTFPVTMRTTPTVTVLHCHNMMGTTDISGTTAPIRLADGVSYFMNTNNPFTVGAVYALDFEASAEL